MSGGAIKAAVEREAAKYPGALRQRIVSVNAVTRSGGLSAGRFRRLLATPKVKHRTSELSCGHHLHDRAEGADALVKRSVGDVVACEKCGDVSDAVMSRLLWLMEIRTRAAWAPIFRGNDYRPAETWSAIKPLLLPEHRDPRVDEFFAATAEWARKPYETTASEEARQIALIPAILNVVLRDPIQEPTPAPKPAKKRGAK